MDEVTKVLRQFGLKETINFSGKVLELFPEFKIKQLYSPVDLSEERNKVFGERLVQFVAKIGQSRQTEVIGNELINAIEEMYRRLEKELKKEEKEKKKW